MKKYKYPANRSIVFSFVKFIYFPKKYLKK